MTPPRIVGLDLSLTGTAMAVGAYAATRIPTRADQGDRRLVIIRDEVAQLITRVEVDVAVIEDLPAHAHAAGLTGMVQGVVRAALLDADVPYALVPAATLKRYATGRGNATKADMRMALYQRLGIDEPDDNRVDARWLAAMGLDYYGWPAVHMPQKNRAALGKVEWPALRKEG